MLAWLGTKMGLYVLTGIAVAIALGSVYHHVWHNGYVKGEAEIQGDWDADKARRIRAFSDAMTKYETAKEEAEKNAKARDAEREKRNNDAKMRALNLPSADAGLRFPASARRVLNDAIGDPAPAPGPPVEPAKSPAAPAEDSTVSILTQWGVGAIDSYNECRDEVIGWQSFYHSLQQAQPEVKP